MGAITDQLTVFWVAKIQSDKVNEAKGKIQNALNVVYESADELQSLVDSGLFEGLATETKKAFKAAIKVLTNARDAMNADLGVVELLEWKP